MKFYVASFFFWIIFEFFKKLFRVHMTFFSQLECNQWCRDISTTIDWTDVPLFIANLS
jgi:hypothetical protein